MDWKSRLYDSYVSNKQAGIANDSEKSLNSSRSFYIRSLITRHIPINRDSRIVDLGCGYGLFLYELRQAGYQKIGGVDHSGEQVKVAHSLGIRDVEQGDIKEYLIRLPDRSVDVVLIMDVLEHLTREELFVILDEVLRVLDAGGICMAHVPNAEGLFGMRIRYGDLTHEQAYTSKSIRQAFLTVGFSTPRCVEDKPVVHGLMSLTRRALWEIGTIYPRVLLAAETGEFRTILSQNMLVIAQK